MNPAICAHFLDFVRQIASRIRSQMAVAQTVENRNRHSLLPVDVVGRHPVNVLSTDALSGDPPPSSAFSRRNSSCRTGTRPPYLFGMKDTPTILTERTDDTSAILQWSTGNRARKCCVSCSRHAGGSDHTRRSADDKSDSRNPSLRDKTPGLHSSPSALPPPL